MVTHRLFPVICVVLSMSEYAEGMVAAPIGRTLPSVGAEPTVGTIAPASAVSYADGAVVSKAAAVTALERLRQDLEQLDADVSGRPRVSLSEGTVLGSSVALSVASPLLFSAKVVELVVPTAALVVAAIGVAAEYGGRVATANGKEVAAASLRTAAEAEALLANAERSKAVIPMTVGISASAVAVALILPATVERLIWFRHKPSEVLVLMPIVALFCSAVAALAELEVKSFCGRATSLGRRRFAKADEVGKSWLSQTEMVFGGDAKLRRRWKSFAWGVLPAPIVGLLFINGSLAFRALVTAAFAAAQAAFYLASAEYYVARSCQAVADKLRTAAIADTYANQASRVGALLPFTSALGGLTAAGAAVVVELQPIASSIFPVLGAVFAAAASVSKACCEADASAASAAVVQLSSSTEEDRVPSFISTIFAPIRDLFRGTSQDPL